ncbi:glycerate kinase [Rudaeicoccus suwonensis]|uniref:glycerate kinase n=1 Tax=Rudaeicoccus suwonensis TaxID=657409 RepID=UPI001476AC7A|nr:glycerate kinase [Rudaeicoccus suwonensis]
MRVLVTSDHWGELSASEATTAIVVGWQERAPFVDIDALPFSAGGRGFVAALDDAIGGSRVAVAASSATWADVLVSNGCTYVEAAQVCPGGDSTGLGTVIDNVLHRGARRIVVGVGDIDGVDGGRGLIEAIGRSADLATALAAARERLSDVELTVAYDNERTLLGLQGACAAAVESLGWDPRVAQEAEAAMGRYADHVRRLLPVRRDLISGKEHRLDREPGAGAGGGIAFGLAALGGRLLAGASCVADVVGLRHRVGAADLVVVGTQTFDWRCLGEHPVSTVVRAAAAEARPTVVLAEHVEVGRRETMSLGASAAYSVIDPMSRRQPPAPSELRGSLQALARRVAGTWTPRPHGDVG